jgi:hypothetical protein
MHVPPRARPHLIPLLTPFSTHTHTHTQAQEEVALCESEATKKGVQAAAAAKALDKLRREGAKAAEEREKLAAQQEKTTAEFKALEDAAFTVLDLVQKTQVGGGWGGVQCT